MSNRHRFVAMALLVVVCGGCAAIPPPPKYNDLKLEMGAISDDDVRYDNARQQLAAATQALEDRDAANAERYAILGWIEYQIASARIAQAEVMTNTEVESGKLSRLKDEVAMWEAKVSKVLDDDARQSVRAHIEAVIAQNVLDAAAAQELESHMDGAGERKMADAQIIVAKELLAMAQTRIQIVQIGVKSGFFLAEQLQPMNGALALMEKAVLKNDLAAVYQFAERSMSLFHAYMDEGWMLHNRSVSEVQQQLLREVQNESLAYDIDEIGIAIGLTAKLDGRDNLSDEATAKLEQIAALMQRNPDVYALILISGSQTSMPAARKLADAAAPQIRHGILRFGVNAARVFELKFLGERPLRALSGDKPRAAVVLLTFPTHE